MGINEVKNGLAIIFNNDPWVINSFQQVKPGKGQAFLKVKMRNLKSGKVLDVTFRSSENIEEANVEKASAQYLYNQGDELVFMDNTTYEQYSLKKSVVGDKCKFLKDGVKTILLKLDDIPFNVEIPTKVDLKVVETLPGEKGDTTSNATKPAILETGAEISVPLFIGMNDIVRVNTDTGKYVERVQKG